MGFIRQYGYYLFAILWTLILGILSSPLLLLKQPYWVWKLSVFWERGLLWWLCQMVGVCYRITGQEHLIKPPFVLAIKHQSAFETLLLSVNFFYPCVILKKELLAIPIFGAYLKAADNIAIDRKSGGAAMLSMVKIMKKQLAKKRVLIIFPEGTRSAVGKTRAYQSGVYMMSRLGVPVYPVALNSGCFWQKNRFQKGIAELAILPAMPQNLSKQDFLEILQKKIESTTRRLEKNAMIK
ncbi:MAG: lysophospholipid acyltransferase family protein [Alphaproteobacteria bacterium]